MRHAVKKTILFAVVLVLGLGCVYIHQLLTGFYGKHPFMECMPEKIIISEYKAFRPPGDTAVVLCELSGNNHTRDIQKIVKGIEKSRRYTLPSKIPWVYQLKLVCGDGRTENIFVAHDYIGMRCNDTQDDSQTASLLNYHSSSGLFLLIDDLVKK